MLHHRSTQHGPKHSGERKFFQKVEVRTVYLFIYFVWRDKRSLLITYRVIRDEWFVLLIRALEEDWKLGTRRSEER